MDTLNFSRDDGEYSGPMEIPVGTNAKLLRGYNVKNNVQNLKITINGQYELTTGIE